ncbi:MAG: DUF3656 domain-containing U32 family peptidase [Acholeplasmataceae bacterium]
MKKVELLAPAGNKQAMIGAINAGADAVYLAGKKFGARAFANNFDMKSLKEMIAYAHMRGVLVYVTVNTLIYNHELSAFLSYTDDLVTSQVDALIVQDFGMIDLLVKRYPKTDIHVSTQANTHFLGQARFLKALGASRIILARETTADMVTQIKAHLDIELEVFIHGALCISYSGQCLISSLALGRSANKGECAQMCRLPYQLVEGKKIVSDEAYLLSSKDLLTIDHIAELLALGIDSLKIEGRMRRAEYVVQTVLSYKNALNMVIKRLPANIDEEIKNLKKVFNRAYTKGYMFQENNLNITNIDRPNHQGIPLGVVIGAGHHHVLIQLDEPLSVGDGIRFLNDDSQDFGDLVSRIRINDVSVPLAQKGDIVTIDVAKTVAKDTQVIKTKDMRLELELATYFDPNYKRIPLKGSISVKTGDYIEFIIQLDGHTWTLYSEDIVDEAINQVTSNADIKRHLSKLGDTPYYYQSLHIDNDQQSFVPAKWLNDLRKEALDLLVEAQLNGKETPINGKPYIDIIPNHGLKAGLVCKVSTIDQLNTCYDLGIQTIYYDHYLDFQKTQYPNAKLIMVVPRILDEPIKLPQRILVDTLSSDYKQTQEVYGNTFLNVTNSYTANLLMRHGFKRVTLSPELSYEDVMSFHQNYLNEFKQSIELEMVVYGKTEVMLTRHALIDAIPNFKKDVVLYRKHQYSLRDQKGRLYPIMGDGLGHTRILFYEAVSLLHYIEALKEASIHTYRLEFTHESKSRTHHVIRAFQRALDNPLDIPELNFKTNVGRFIPKGHINKKQNK